jgi:Ca-activated chloride channel family protein
VIRFEYPWLLVLLAVVPALLAWRARRPRTARAAVLWGTVAGLPKPGLGAWIVEFTRVLPWAALVLAIVAAARPQQGVQQSEVDSRGVDIVLAIDISRSMSAGDMGGGSRLDVARSTAKDFVRGRPHDRVGIVGFAGTAFTQCPLTLDHETLATLVDGIDFGLAEDGTAIGMGLANAVGCLRNSKTPSRVVVLLTDGQNNRGAIDPLTGAELAHALGIKVYTVLAGRGGVVPVPVDDPVRGRRIEMVRMDVDEGVLREIAQRTGGRFFRAQDPAALAGIYAEIDRLERAPIKSIQYREYRDLAPALLGVAAALLAAHALLSTTLFLRLP